MIKRLELKKSDVSETFYDPVCRLCGGELANQAARMIGICNWCIVDDRFAIGTIKRPMYGRFNT
jgi:hypothetical protein